MGLAICDCPNLITIHVSEEHPNYTVVDGVLYYQDNEIDDQIGQPMFALTKYPSGKQEAGFSVPDGVNCINAEAFQGCDNLVYVYLPDSLIKIGYSAFWECENLRYLNIPASVTELPWELACDCDQLVLYVNSGTFAEEYCREAELQYRIIEEIDLNDDLGY